MKKEKCQQNGENSTKNEEVMTILKFRRFSQNTLWNTIKNIHISESMMPLPENAHNFSSLENYKNQTV